jgi:phasin family protein
MPAKPKTIAATDDVTQIVADAAATSSAQAQKLIEDSTAQAQKIIEDSTSQARIVLEKSMEQAHKTAADMSKAAEEAAAFSRGNVEAFTKAAQLYFTGVQDLGRQVVATMQGLSDHTLEGVKAMSSARSLKDVADLQASLARTAFEKSIADATKLQEAAMKVAEEAFAPISARVTVAVEKLARPIAA